MELKLVKSSVKEVLYLEENTLHLGYKAMFTDTGYRTQFAVALVRIFKEKQDIPEKFKVEIKEVEDNEKAN